MKQAPEVTKEDLVQYGIFASLTEVPDGYQKLVNAASDMVMYAIKNNYNPLSEAHVLAVKKAICNQVSYWNEKGTNHLNDSDVSSYSLGELSVNISSNPSTESQSHNHLCPSAVMYLNDAYLLYRGMRHGRF